MGGGCDEVNTIANTIQSRSNCFETPLFLSQGTFFIRGNLPIFARCCVLTLKRVGLPLLFSFSEKHPCYSLISNQISLNIAPLFVSACRSLLGQSIRLVVLNLMFLFLFLFQFMLLFLFLFMFQFMLLLLSLLLSLLFLNHFLPFIFSQLWLLNSKVGLSHIASFSHGWDFSRHVLIFIFAKKPFLLSTFNM